MNDQNPKSQFGHWDFLLILLAALLPTYLMRFSVLGIPTNFFEAAVAVVFLIGIFQPRIRRAWLQAFRSLPKPFLIAILLLLISAMISTLISPHLFTSLGILKSWIIAPMIFGWMVYAQGLKIENWNLKIARSLIFSGVVVSLLSLSQLGTIARIHGPYDVPNSLALYLAPLIVLSALRMTRYSLLAATIMFAALLFTQSVAGVLSVIVVLAIGFLVLKRTPLKSPLSGGRVGGGLMLIVFIAIFLVLLPKINYLLQPSSSAAVRLQLWSISWDLIKQHPILGIGLGTFEPAYQQKLHEQFARPASAGQPAPLAEFVFRDPHNWILSFWLNLGLLGLLSFAAIHIYVFRLFIGLPREALAKWGNWSLSIGVCGALATLLLFGLLDTIFWKNDLAALHFLLVSLALRSKN